jgi:C4-dicarboxylate transporter DctM subunit
MNLVIGALTPPLGMLVFTTARVGEVPVTQVFRAVLPFLAALLLVLNLVIGALTPPLGMLVFTTARVGHVPVSEVFRAVLPLIGALLVVLGLVTYVPELTLVAVRWIGP